MCFSCFGLSLTESLGIAQCNMRLGNYIACRLCRVLDGSLFTFARGPSLTFTSAHVLVRALVDGPSFSHTDRRGHIECSLCSRAHFGRVPTADL